MKQNLDILLQNSQKELNTYIELLKKWQKAVNLISNSTVNDIWSRHIIDSAQLYLYIPENSRCLVDIGSGAGFPGLVLAILNQKNQGALNKIILIESDIKKCLFLKEVIRTLSLPVQVLNQRIESVSEIQTDVLTARALAPLNELLLYAKNIITPRTTCLFLKGKNSQQEIQDNTQICKIQNLKSLTSSDGCILKITEVYYD